MTDVLQPTAGDARDSTPPGVRLAQARQAQNLSAADVARQLKLSVWQVEALEGHAWEIIAQRESHPGRNIAWLYDPGTMPAGLLDAHRALDETFERIYVGRPFRSDTERLEHLFEVYVEMTSSADEAEAALA